MIDNPPFPVYAAKSVVYSEPIADSQAGEALVSRRATDRIVLPRGFWSRPEVISVLKDRDIGRIFHLVRQHAGASQTQLAIACGMTQGKVSEYMKRGGRQVLALEVFERVADGLGLPDEARLTLGIAPRSHGVAGEGRPAVAFVSQVPEERGRGSAAKPRSSSIPQSRVDIPSRPVEALPNPISAGGDCYTAAMQQFRAADRNVGGGHLYVTVVRYLHTEVAPQLFEIAHHDDGHSTFIAAAALTEMAGWMAHDAGQDEAAWRHFNRSYQLVGVGNDPQLKAHVLASLSHLAHHLGQPRDALRFAQHGQDLLAVGPQQPELEARLLAMQARGLAALQRSKESARLLHQAERMLTLSPAEEPSPWVSRFDKASLASETARCLRQLGDLQQAQGQAERIIALRSGDRTRSRAFGQLLLATVLIARGEPDEACAVAQAVLGATQQLGSYLVLKQLIDLKQLLKPYWASSRAVASFLPCLEGAVSERLWLYQWLTRDVNGERARGR